MIECLYPGSLVEEFYLLFVIFFYLWHFHEGLFLLEKRRNISYLVGQKIGNRQKPYVRELRKGEIINKAQDRLLRLYVASKLLYVDQRANLCLIHINNLSMFL